MRDLLSFDDKGKNNTTKENLHFDICLLFLKINCMFWSILLRKGEYTLLTPYYGLEGCNHFFTRELLRNAELKMDEELFSALKENEIHEVCSFPLQYVRQHIVMELIKKKIKFSVFLSESARVRENSPYSAFHNIMHMQYSRDPKHVPLGSAYSDVSLCNATFTLGFAPVATGA